MRGSKRLFCIGLISVLVSMFLALPGVSQAETKYPTRAIDVIVPFAPGASTDLSARVVADFIRKMWQVPVNVINKPGGNTIPASLEVAKAAPDGYTMFSENQNAATMVAALFKEEEIPYKLMDRSFIAMTIVAPTIVIVSAGSPIKNMKDLEAEAKKSLGDFTWTSLGGTSTLDVTALTFLKAIGVDSTKTKPVICTGGSVALTMTAGGHVKMGVVTSSGPIPAIKSGLVRALGISGKTRHPALPDVPTFTELGYPTVGCVMWNGLSGPPGLPGDVVAKWVEAIREISKDPKYIEQVGRIGCAVNFLGPQELREYILKEIADIKSLGLKKFK